MDSSVLLEALSCLTGLPVVSRADDGGEGGEGGEGACLDPGELTVYNFVSSALLPLILCKEEVRGSQPEEPKQLHVNLDSFYAPQFNYDFRALKDETECARGGEPYRRPCGWFRFALKVLGKYPDGDAWLGPGGWRNRSASGEWPVSYHGTGREGRGKGAEGEGPQEFGIFSTPDIGEAERDAELHKEFTSRNGKTYRVIMQNRISPEHRVRKSDTRWLVRVPLEVHALTDRKKRRDEMKRIVEQSIRPYGVLLKEM